MDKLIPWVRNSDLKLRGRALILPYTINTCFSAYPTPRKWKHLSSTNPNVRTALFWVIPQ
jgi:hypothetical protein